MLIDTSAKTVTFTAGEVLDLPALWAIISLLDIDDPEPESVTFTQIPSEYVRESDIVRIHAVRSDESQHYYAVVEFAGGYYACSCKDWIHRRSTMPFNSPCKHILRVHFRGM